MFFPPFVAILRTVLRSTVSFLLLTSLLLNSAFAAPDTGKFLFTEGGEFIQDARYAFIRNSTSINWSAGNYLAFLTGDSRKKSSDSPVRIEIMPGHNSDGTLRVRQGDPINFSATAYSSEGLPIGGLRFDWMLVDIGRNKEYRLADGVFSARKAGSFRIDATVDGLRSSVNLIVEENPAYVAMERIRNELALGNNEYVQDLIRRGLYSTGEISSRQHHSPTTTTENPTNSQSLKQERSHGPNGGSEETEIKASPMRPADEDGWNNGNWWLADDPGNQTGNSPGTSPSAGVGNGNFQFSAPVAALPGRGIDISLSLNYNSRVWSKSGNTMIYDAERGFPAPGWNLGFGKMMFMGSGGGCMLIDADGTQHGYTGTLSNFSSGSYSSTSFSGHTADGTFIDYSCSVSTYSGVTTMYGSASLPNGTKVTYNVMSANGKQAFPSQISDIQGNYINAAYRNNKGPELQTVTDTMGRTISFDYDSSGRLISVNVPKLNNAGTRTAIQLHYKSLTLNPGWASGITSDTNNWNPNVIDAIYYPSTSTGYWFDDNDSYSSYGMIAKVLEHRGMSWSGTTGTQGTVTSGTMSKQAVYNYTLTPNTTLTDAPTYTSLTESWAGMDTSPAVTTYSYNPSDYHSDGNSNSPCRTIQVTQPNGLISTQYSYRTPGSWTDGLLFADETTKIVGTTPQAVSSSIVSWQQGNYDSARPAHTFATDEKGQTLRTSYTYGSNYNQVTSQKDYDFDGTTVLREVRKTYENNTAYTSRHLFNLIKSNEVYTGAGVKVARTDYEYDNNAVVNGTGNPDLKETAGVTMHLSTHDPYTTELQNGYCSLWYPTEAHTPECSYEGQTVTVIPAGPYDAECRCQEYEQVSVYDSNTEFRGNLTKVTDYSDAANGTGAIALTKNYDETGNLVSESASCCELKTYDYTLTTQYAYPTTSTRGAADPNSNVRNTATSVYDFNTGLVTQSTDPNGLTSTSAYDADTLRPTQVTTSTGSYSTTAYNENAMTVTRETYEYGGALAGKSIEYLNGVGATVRVDSIGPSSVTDISETKYDVMGRVWKQSRPYRTGDTVQWSEKFYDIQGRVTKIAEPDGSETTAYYNETARPDSASNLAGSTLRVSDAWGRERWGRYDALGRLAEVAEPNPNGNGSVTASGSLITNYTYDVMERLTQTDQGSQTRKFKYDSLGRLTRQKLAEQTATLNDSGTYVGSGGTGANWAEAYFYDSRSNLTQKTDPRGVKTLYSYQISGNDDPLNRLQSKSYDTSGPIDTSITIHTAAPTVYEYMTTGDQDRVKKVTTTGIFTEEYTYDAQARVSDYKQTYSGRESYPWVTSYVYDTLDRVKEMRYPAAYGLTGNPRKLIENAFDSSSRLTTLKADGVQQAGDFVYNAASQTTSVNIGATGTNQINEQYTFDPQSGLLTGQKAIKNSTTILDLSYDYSRNTSLGSLNGRTGHLTRVLDNLNHNKDRDYKFDAIGRLITAKGGDITAPRGAPQWTQTYGYDRYGNRTSVSSSGVAANSSVIPADGIPSLAFDSASNRITTSGYQYDVAGNQIKALGPDGTTWLRYEYDAANRLRLVKKDSDGSTLEAYVYGATNARLIDYKVSVGYNKFLVNVGGTALVEYMEYSGNVLTWSKSYTYLGDSQLSTITPNGSGGETTEFNHPDRLGMRLVTNQSAGTVMEQAHLPFGNALDAESTLTTNNKRFTSYDRSASTGLDYAINRNYDALQGRFTQVDPIKMGDSSLSNPQSFNLYTYCQNDPINHTDPSGLGFFSFLKKLFKWVMVIIAVIVAVLVIMAAPATIAGVLGAISAAASAGSSVMNALGFTTAAKILGWIAIGAGIGAGIATIATMPKIDSSMIMHIASTAENTTTIPWWQIALGAISAAGAIGNSFAGPRKRNKKPTPCDLLAKNTVFTNWAKELWKNARSTTPWHETGGLFGHEETNAGTSVTATYDRLSESRSLPGFTGWMSDTKAINSPRNIHWEYWVHTHPVSGETKPSGISGDLSMTNIAELPAVIIGAKGKFSIWGVNNTLICNGSIGKVS